MSLVAAPSKHSAGPIGCGGMEVKHLRGLPPGPTLRSEGLCRCLVTSWNASPARGRLFSAAKQVPGLLGSDPSADARLR